MSRGGSTNAPTSVAPGSVEKSARDGKPGGPGRSGGSGAPGNAAVEGGREPGRRELRKEATRRELILAGRKLFGERGLYESRIEDLTSMAGVAKGTIYGYFDNKEELILAVEVAGLRALLDHVQGRVAGARTRRDSVRRMVAAHFEFFEANIDLVKLFHQVRGMLKFDRREWEPLRAGLEEYVKDLARLLVGRANAAGAPTAEDREAAELLFGSVSGITSLGIALRAGGSRQGRGSRSARGERTVEAVVSLVMSRRAT